MVAMLRRARRHDGKASVLKESFFIDGAASEFQTSCFRPDGTLAFVLIEGTAANVYRDPAAAPQYVTREGRFYLSPNGGVIQKAGQVTMDGKRVGDFDSREFQPGRTCQSLGLHLTLERVRQHMVSRLGDIYGNRPGHEPNKYSWCGALETQ